MDNGNPEVERLLDKVDHPQKEAIEYLRTKILAADPNITEQWKWNAPSFCYDSVDRITFQLRSEEIQLIFHRGAKAKDGDPSLEFDDDSGLLKWRSIDRGVVRFKDLVDIEANDKAFIALRWIVT